MGELMPVLGKLEESWGLVDPNSQEAAARTGEALRAENPNSKIPK